MVGKQEPLRQFAEPATDRMSAVEMDWQRMSAATQADRISDHVNHLAELDIPRMADTHRFGHQRRHPLPSSVRHVRWIALCPSGNPGHSGPLL